MSVGFVCGGAGALVVGGVVLVLGVVVVVVVGTNPGSSLAAVTGCPHAASTSSVIPAPQRLIDMVPSGADHSQ
jgi:hypothetical protein